MIQLITDKSGIQADIVAAKLADYTEYLRQVRDDDYKVAESSINLPTDDALLAEVQKVVEQKKTSNLKYNIVIGIGGSNLGTKAVYDALYGYREALEPARFPKLLFAETTSPIWLEGAQTFLANLESKDEVIITLISKSGGTTETIANYEIIMQSLRESVGDALDRVVVITDKDSTLWNTAKGQGISCLTIPAPVGGRYSVLSAVGLFPLATVDVDIISLRDGAAAMLEACLSGYNSAAQSAAVLAAGLSKGYTINDTFLFNPELESLGKWYRQLMGESVGKEKTLDGATAHIGITPTVSLGSTDLHSVGQLYLGGPKDKLTTFVSCTSHSQVTVPTDRTMPHLVPMISGKTAEQIMQAILRGVQLAYQKADLPYMEVVFDDINAQSLGAFLQFKMLEMMYLGRLLNVNSFDQPNVEAYKVETKRLLEA